MCVDEFGISFKAGEKLLTQSRDLCNKDLAVNRGLICQALVAFMVNRKEVLHCLDGNSPCGFMGMLWKKYLNGNIKIDINRLFFHSSDVIEANLKNNHLEAHVVKEDPCVNLRKKSYDFIFLNCKTTASHYLDSAFCRVNDNGIIVVSTSEDPSQYWQSPGVALKNYGGVIVKTSYFREMGIRLVTAEMARAAARYNRGIEVLCCVSFKAQQSFTIIVRVKKDAQSSAKCMMNIQRLVHCSVCEDRNYVPNSEFVISSPASLLSCNCSRNSEAKTVNELGPIWSGEIFSASFIESMIANLKGYPWKGKIAILLMQIFEEAKCNSGELNTKEPDAKKTRFEHGNNCSDEITEKQPSFYINTHRYRPLNHQLLKMTSIIEILRSKGFRASRTHFDPKAIRTNASVRDYMQLLEERH